MKECGSSYNYEHSRDKELRNYCLEKLHPGIWGPPVKVIKGFRQFGNLLPQMWWQTKLDPLERNIHI